MAIECQTVPSADALASGFIGYLDCQAQSLASQGYAALAVPGSSISILLTALLAIFVALFGYRMLFGETPTIRDGVLALAKIGIVLAFSLNWPAYQTVVYDVALRGPANLVSEVGAPAELPGTTGGLPSRLDGVDQSFRTLTYYGVGARPFDPTGRTPVQIDSPVSTNFEAFALGASRLAFLVGALAGFALVRITAAILLALGPLFFAFLLFDGTRGLFEGWARALIGTALSAVAIALLLGVELALLEPWLADLVSRRVARFDIVGVPAGLFAVTLVFNLALVGLLGIVTRLVFTTRFSVPAGRRPPFDDRADSLQRPRGAEPRVDDLMPTAGEARSRAAVIADQILSVQRREEQVSLANQQSAVRAVSGVTDTRPGGALAETTLSSGLNYRKRTTKRVSASAARRDRTV